MRSRCRNHDDVHYQEYGGRGITVCDRWQSFEAFLADMGERPAGMTLDRIDNDGNYEPGNCRWASAKDQARNRRDNRIIEFRGRTQSLATWCDELHLDYHVVHYRLKKNYPLEIAFGLEPRTGRRLVPSQNRLTPAVVAEIRALRGKIPQRELARKFGVAPSSINRVQTKDLPENAP